ncbi:Na(+)/H(+) antiporter NhaA [Geotalea uraniireducens]|uniref:Na(+)/H(+) antiporter NhaA n=1 Tax=Geotalea uraniireducens TaxID=351604 RepID=A0ABN6VPB7_9BACT|nr:Na+/H+ antiporter NhaA [Geotalea uraniireducens]BDV42028.1 Na(+)/H(+) antiporter NhaA [Geotalea uraniireducens]
MKKRLNLLREFSVPLIAGVVLALWWANRDPAGYDHFLHTPLFGGVSFHFLANDIFMVFFFAIAAVEITQSCLPGGDLNPPRKALNPLLATLGGVVGPALVFLLLNHVIGSAELRRGWGIPTATDIAFAWLVARLVFGKDHPAISFLLLLAVADDGIGLAIIAIFYPNPNFPVAPAWLLLTVGGMAVAYLLRSARVKSYWPYLLVGGGMSWAGLYNAHLHPALALVFIIPFLPHARKERLHLFEEDEHDRSTIARFEQDWKVIVDFGMFMFGLANAGVEFSSVGTVTWIVFLALLLGKCGGIFLLGSAAERFGFPLPHGMRKKELFVAGIIGGFGFTVALFVSGEAFLDPAIQGAAKMGAMLSASVALVALVAGRALRVGRAS